MRALLDHPRVYALWQMPFAAAKFAPVLRHGESASARRVLDIGCGPGTSTRYFPDADYVGVDVNPRYVEQARRRYGDRFQVADVTRDELPAGGPFDFVLVNSLLHHLETTDVRALLAAAAGRLSDDGRIHVLDLVLPERAGLGRLLARWDRGDHPRPLDEWRALFGEAFEPVVLEPYPLPRRPPLWNMVYFQGRRRL